MSRRLTNTWVVAPRSDGGTFESVTGSARTRKTRVLVRVLAAVLVVVTVVLVFTALRWVLWLPEDDPVTADAVVVFAGGRDGDRFERALELMEDGVAPTVVISIGNDRWHRGTGLGELCDKGSLDFAVVCVAPTPDTTIGEAALFAEVARSRGFEDLVVVSSSWHLHRARLWLDRCHGGQAAVVGTPTARGLGDLAHEIAGTMHAMVFDRACPSPVEGAVTADWS